MFPSVKSVANSASCTLISVPLSAWPPAVPIYIPVSRLRKLTEPLLFPGTSNHCNTKKSRKEPFYILKQPTSCVPSTLARSILIASPGLNEAPTEVIMAVLDESQGEMTTFKLRNKPNLSLSCDITKTQCAAYMIPLSQVQRSPPPQPQESPLQARSTVAIFRSSRLTDDSSTDIVDQNRFRGKDSDVLLRGSELGLVLIYTW